MNTSNLTKWIDELQGQIDQVKRIALAAGGGDTVTITPALESGTKVADYSIGSDSGSLFAPTIPSIPPLFDIETTETEIGQFDGKPLYAKLYKNVSVTNNTENVVDANFASTNTLVWYNIAPLGAGNLLVNASTYINDSLYTSDAGLKYYFNKSDSIGAYSSINMIVLYTKAAAEAKTTRSKKK